MAKIQNATLIGTLWALTAVFVWSGSLVLLRLGVTTHLNAYDLTALRFGSAALVLMPVSLKTGFAFRRLGVFGLVLAICGFGAPYIVLVSQALQTAPASAAGAFNPGIMAVSSAVLGAMLFQDRLGWLRGIGILCILAGLLGSAWHHPTGLTTGHVILILTGVMWAVYAAVVRRARILALHATAIVAVGSALVYLPIYFTLLPKRIADAPLQDIMLQAGFQGVLVSVFAVFAFNRSAELLGPVIGATLPALIPLVTLGLGLAILAEPAGASEVITALIIGVGVALILMGRSRKPVPPPKTMAVK